MDRLLETQLNITKSHVEVVELPFNTPVYLPFGKIDTRPSAWLQVEGEVNGEAAQGCAEGTALPMQIPMYDDCSDNLSENITRIIAEIANRDMRVGEAITQISELTLVGNFATARMTVEAAILDMIARAQNSSVADIILNKDTVRPLIIPYGKSIAENAESEILRACDEAVANGAKRLKFKLSPINYLNLRAALGVIMQRYPDASVMVDANGMFDPEDIEHMRMLHDIDSLGLLTIEEPVSRAGRLRGMAAHIALKKTLPLKTPVTMDDAIKTVGDAVYALDNNLAQIVNLKPGRVGSFIECMRIADYAKQSGKEVMVGGMFEATPGRMMTLTLGAYCLQQGFKIPGDLSLPQERLSKDIVEPSLFLNNQQEVVFNPVRGWGYEI